MYDFLIVGSGLFGATFAWQARQQGRSCLVIDKRRQAGGNLYCDEVEGINVHRYGAHIFHTDNDELWQTVNRLVALQPALQHEHILPDVGRTYSCRSRAAAGRTAPRGGGTHEG